jgi:hypothetical protein
MARHELKVFVSHSQLAVFHHSLDRPFNTWTKRHVAQGFSWRPGSVSFGTLEEGGNLLVTLSDDESLKGEPPSDAARIIDVPFEVPADGAVEIGSIAGGESVELPAGLYQLRFENYRANEGELPRARLLFSRDSNPRFRIVRADAELAPEGDLLLSALPA